MHLFCVSIVTVLVALLPLQAEAILVGTALLPHGDFAYDPLWFPPNSQERDVAERVAVESRRAALSLIVHGKPDVIFLTTPHGIKLDKNFALYMNSEGSGYATIGSDSVKHKPNINKSMNIAIDIGMDTNIDWTPKDPYNITLQANLAAGLSKDLLDTLQQKQTPTTMCSGIYSYDDNSPLPLGWGEVTPLSLLPSKRLDNVTTMILSYPHLRYEHAPDMMDDLLGLGGNIGDWIHQRPERIAVIISGDMSHTHLADGPYGYSNASQPFDVAVGEWAANPTKSSHKLLHTARNLQNDALSCGFTGYVLWHGMMTQTLHPTWEYESKVLINRNVTYYGMLAATFTPVQPKIANLSRMFRGSRGLFS